MRSIFEEAVAMAREPRTDVHSLALWLGRETMWAERDVKGPLVEGEEGPANVRLALDQLIVGRTKKADRELPGRALEVWMLAEIVAAGVCATHEVRTGELLEPNQEAALHHLLTDFGLRAPTQPLENAEAVLAGVQPY